MEQPLPLNLSKEFIYRFLSGLVGIPLVLYITILGFPFFHLLIATMLFIACLEWNRMTTINLSLVWIVFTSLITAYGYLESPYTLLTLGSTFLFITTGILWKTRAIALIPIAGFSYIIAAFYAMIMLYDSKGPQLFFILFCLVWSADIGAYFVGKALKGPKLAPRLSPNKTWSGFLGGSLASYMTTTLAMTYVDIKIPALLLVTLILLSHAGDLLESIVKRYYNVKDSGAIIPGHGGILDRLDSLMLVSIGAFIALCWSLF